jgi:hypothetical protein
VGSSVLEFVLSTLATAALFSLVACIAWRRMAARPRAWMALARELGCHYSREDTASLPEVYQHPVFRGGCRQCAENVLSGTYRGHQFRCFDYSVLTSRRDHSPPSRRTIVAMVPPGPFRQVVIRPEGLSDRVARAAGLPEVELESTEFNRRFHVECDDPKFAFDLLHVRAMECLLAWRGVVVEGDSTAVVFHAAKPGWLTLPRGVREMLDLACDFLDLVPEYMRRG